MHLCRYPQFLQPPRPIMMEFTIIGPIYHNHEPKTKAIEKKELFHPHILDLI